MQLVIFICGFYAVKKKDNQQFQKLQVKGDASLKLIYHVGEKNVKAGIFNLKLNTEFEFQAAKLKRSKETLYSSFEFDIMLLRRSFIPII